MKDNKTKENEEENEICTPEEYKERLKQVKYKFVLWTAILLIIAVSLSITITYYIYEGRKYDQLYRATDKVIENGDKVITATDAISDISTVLVPFAQVIDEKYVGDISQKEIVEQTIKGFVKGLGDEYSEYMTKEEVDKYMSDNLGNYVGIGVYISENDDKNTIIIGVMKDSPAEKVGLKAEDYIIEIDGESALGIGVDEVSRLIKGEEGTTVKLKILRGEEELEFTVERDDIKVYHVEYEVLDNNVGYVSLLTFDEGCAEEMKNALTDLKNKGVNKVILDLRYNTGGLLKEALDMLDMLLDDGQIELITKSADGTETIDKARGNKDFDCELVVLSNEYSASASEVLIASLKENGRAKIVGTKTYGKGVIQNFYELSNGGALKLTTEEFFTPKNNKINKVGIEPDYVVELDEEALKNGVDSQLEKAKEILK